MSRQASTIDVDDYRDEFQRHLDNPPAGYHPAAAKEPRRALTWQGDVLAGSRNGEGHADWRQRHNVIVHIAVSGSSYAYGTSVAACNGSVELGDSALLTCLVKACGVDEELRCRRPACRALWPKTSAPVPAQSPPTDGDRMT